MESKSTRELFEERSSRHVVHLSTVHHWSDTRVFHKECRSLHEAGYSVTLIARAEREDRKYGVKIIPVRIGGVNRFVRMTKGVLETLRLATAEKGDIYHIHDAELLPVAVLLRFSGKQVIYDAHEDLVGQIKSKSWLPRHLRSAVAITAGAVERVCASLLTAVVIANPLQNYRFRRKRTFCIQNFPTLAEMESIGTRAFAERDECVFYVGGLSEIRGVRQMVDAIELVNRTQPAKLRLAGGFSPAFLEHEITSMSGARFTEFLGKLDRDQVVDELRQAKIGLVVVHPVPNFLTNQPVKLFEYMMAGVPVVASHFPNYRQFVSEIGSGLMVDPMAVQEIAEAVTWLLSHPAEAQQMGEQGRQAVLDVFNWEAESEKLVSLYDSL